MFGVCESEEIEQRTDASEVQARSCDLEAASNVAGIVSDFVEFFGGLEMHSFLVWDEKAIVFSVIVDDGLEGVVQFGVDFGVPNTSLAQWGPVVSARSAALSFFLGPRESEGSDSG